MSGVAEMTTRLSAAKQTTVGGAIDAPYDCHGRSAKLAHENRKEIHMFMVISYPWPVASAYGQLAPPQPDGDTVAHTEGRPGRTARSRLGVTERELQQLVHLTGWSWLRFSWYRLLLTGSNLTYDHLWVLGPPVRNP